LGELELKTAEQHAVFDTIADAVLTIEDDRVSSCNARFVDVVGRPRDVVIGSPLADLLPGLRAGVLDAGRPPIRIAHVRPDGRRVDLELRGRDLSRPHARQVWTCTDVTEQVRREREMQTLASRDDLTGLINRRALHHLLDLRFATQRPGGLLLVDLDGFKEINDVHGHATGDAVLSVIAQRMRDAAGDAVVGRLGGDEFVVVVEGSGPGEVEEAADAVRQACCQPIEVDEMVMAVAASIGLVRVTEDDDVSSSLRAADEAMYRAKQAGGDRWERSGPCRPRGVSSDVVRSTR